MAMADWHAKFQLNSMKNLWVITFLEEFSILWKYQAALKKSKVVYFLQKFKKIKTYSSLHLQTREQHVFIFFIFNKKYTTFDFFNAAWYFQSILNSSKNVITRRFFMLLSQNFACQSAIAICNFYVSNTKTKSG